MIHFTAPTLRRIKMEVSQLNQQSLASKVRKGRENRSPPQLMIVVASKKPGIYIYTKHPGFMGMKKMLSELAIFVKTRQTRSLLAFLDFWGMLESKVPWEPMAPLHFLRGFGSYKLKNCYNPHKFQGLF